VAAGKEIDALSEGDIKGAAVRVAQANGLDITEADVVVSSDRVFINKSMTVEYTFAKVLGFSSEQAISETVVAKVDGDGTTAS
jgi:hypothetical protein